jgi:hypothetical protein
MMMHGLTNFKYGYWIYAAGLYLIITKFCIFCSSPEVTGLIKRRRTRQTKHVERIEKEIMYTGLPCEKMMEKAHLEN